MGPNRLNELRPFMSQLISTFKFTRPMGARPSGQAWTTMIALTDIEPDTQADLIGAKIAKLQAIPRWNGAKIKLRADLYAMLKFYGYRSFSTDTRDYHLHRVGQSYQYEVPLDKRGHLQPFRGKRVRLVCVWNGRFSVSTMVGVVNEIDIGRRAIWGFRPRASLNSP